jgi:hypothetical protein
MVVQLILMKEEFVLNIPIIYHEILHLRKLI